ncbi:larval cuticle protein 65Ag1-like [Sabethes cyaneus]|uniref:larval cuticle protein 65Ag1-like n=1 Tax=Sabethes cyaneus TaxID=53552 RepID=UPI00237D7D32|nr:larval cuticle protein 65Ag1-like [Sabethes cyaneus]
MKFFVAFAALLAVALAAPAAPASDDASATVLKFDSDVGVDAYNFQYDTSNGIQHQESGQLKTFGDDAAALVVKGSFTYKDAAGQTFTVNYVADENGFQPEGSHLPVGP